MPKGTLLVVTGGVNAANLSDFLAVSNGAGIGSALYAPGKTVKQIRADALKFVHALTEESNVVDILCLGEPLLEFNEQQQPGQYVRSIGGDVSNVAVAVARQVGQAGMLTRMGQDSFADEILQLWERRNRYQPNHSR